jgi:hypothetical protein
MSLYVEAFDHLWNSLAGATDLNATRRLKDYQKRRLRRALLGRSLRSYFLEASWTNTAGTAGEQTVASTKAVTKPLIVFDGAIRSQLASGNDNNFNILLRRTAGDSRVQPSQGFVKDEHILSPAQLAIRNIIASLGQGNCWPLRWPVPMRLAPNELIQITAQVLTGGVTAGNKTWVQFRALNVNNRAEEDAFVADLREAIQANAQQRPLYLQMYSPNASSITFPATGLLQHTTAQTREAPEHLLVLGYAALFARNTANGQGTTCNPKWRLQADNGYTFSREEIDVNCYAYAGPGLFWNELPHPFLLPKGSSLSASFSTFTTIASERERIENYVVFRCVTI